MGNRGNIVIHEKEGGKIFLYTHWGGSDLRETVARALALGKARWDDESYLTRIVFDALSGREFRETGHGISTRVTDNEHPHVNLVMREQVVEIAGVQKSFEDFARQWPARKEK